MATNNPVNTQGYIYGESRPDRNEIELDDRELFEVLLQPLKPDSSLLTSFSYAPNGIHVDPSGDSPSASFSAIVDQRSNDGDGEDSDDEEEDDLLDDDDLEEDEDDFLEDDEEESLLDTEDDDLAEDEDEDDEAVIAEEEEEEDDDTAELQEFADSDEAEENALDFDYEEEDTDDLEDEEDEGG